MRGGSIKWLTNYCEQRTDFVAILCLLFFYVCFFLCVFLFCFLVCSHNAQVQNELDWKPWLLTHTQSSLLTRSLTHGRYRSLANCILSPLCHCCSDVKLTWLCWPCGESNSSVSRFNCTSSHSLSNEQLTYFLKAAAKQLRKHKASICMWVYMREWFRCSCDSPVSHICTCKLSIRSLYSWLFQKSGTMNNKNK